MKRQKLFSHKQHFLYFGRKFPLSVIKTSKIKAVFVVSKVVATKRYHAVF